jgi:glycosyltransferase 2 family protein
MARAVNPVSYTEALHLASRLPGWPRVKPVVAARWLMTVFALWLVLSSIDVGAVLDLVGRAALPTLGLAGFVVAMQFLLLVWRWQLVIRMLGGAVVGLGALSVFLGHSLLIGQVLPSSVGGDVARTLMLARLTGTAAAARSVVCDRLLGLAGLAVLAVPTLPIIAGRVGGPASFLTLTITALGTMAAVALVLASPSIIHAAPWLGRLLATVAGDLRLALWSGKVSLVGVAVGVSSNLLSVLLIYILGSAIGADLRAPDCLVLVPPALLASALPISLGGWGVRESALLAAFSLVQANPAGVAATSVMFGLTNPLVGGIVAVASLFAGWRNVLPTEARDGQ